jgi:hypothetical protein
VLTIRSAAKVKRKVDRLYQTTSRKRRSNRRRKAINTLAATRQRVVRQHVDRAHKLYRNPVAQYDSIAFEDLESRASPPGALLNNLFQTVLADTLLSTRSSFTKSQTQAAVTPEIGLTFNDTAGSIRVFSNVVFSASEVAVTTRTTVGFEKTLYDKGLRRTAAVLLV